MLSTYDIKKYKVNLMFFFFLQSSLSSQTSVKQAVLMTEGWGVRLQKDKNKFEIVKNIYIIFSQLDTSI